MENTEWSKLGFGYFKTDFNIRCYFRNGQWGKLEISTDENISLHMAATCLHYGQEAFEGLKAFRGKDGKIRIFRWDENFKRLELSAKGVMMPVVPKELFKEAVFELVRLNSKYVPSRESESSFYIRPLLIGSGPQVGVKPADEYLFALFGGPVGPYFKEGFKPVQIQIVRDADRAAPLGTGTYKVGGNYAASLASGQRAHKEGFAAALYLDSKEKKYIDECGPANFFAIKNNTYITPKSSSILASITNKSLMTLAEQIGLKVEQRPIPVEELAEIQECGACGTAAVISPVGRIVDRETGKEYIFSKDGKVGPITHKLYEMLRGIQYGDIADTNNWTEIV